MSSFSLAGLTNAVGSESDCKFRGHDFEPEPDPITFMEIDQSSVTLLAKVYALNAGSMLMRSKPSWNNRLTGRRYITEILILRPKNDPSFCPIQSHEIAPPNSGNERTYLKRSVNSFFIKPTQRFGLF